MSGRAVRSAAEKIANLSFSNNDHNNKKRPTTPPPPRPLRSHAKYVKPNPIDIYVNHFKVNCTKKLTKIIHYDVVISSSRTNRNMQPATAAQLDEAYAPSVPDRFLPIIWREFQSSHKDVLGTVVPFDGKKNAYAAKALDFGNKSSKTYTVTMHDPDDHEKTRVYDITLQHTGAREANEIDVESFYKYAASHRLKENNPMPQEVVQAFDVALRYPPLTNFQQVNRSFFHNKDAYTLDWHLELWYGHFQSLLVGSEAGVTLNMDLANKAFLRNLPIIEVLMTILKVRSIEQLHAKKLTQDQIHAVNRYFKGKKVEYRTKDKDNNETYHRFRVISLLALRPCDYSFGPKDGGDMTIFDYFTKSKNVKLNYPNLPLLHVGSPNMTNYVPAEICFLVSEPFKGKVDTRTTAAMIKGAAKPPRERFDMIQNSLKLSNIIGAASVSEFGLQVMPNLIHVVASRLSPPVLQVNDKRKNVPIPKKPDPKEGKWAIGKEEKFYKPAVVPSFICLDLVGLSPGKIRKFLERCMFEAQNLGMFSADRKKLVEVARTAKIESFNQPFPKFRDPQAMDKYYNALRTCLSYYSGKKVSLVFVIISNDGREYPCVKNISEIDVGILTACVKEKTLDGSFQTQLNFLLKLNTKLNGVNFQVAPQTWNQFFKDEKVLVFGADVTHPAPNSNTPSIAAVTASLGSMGMAYDVHIVPQPSRQEQIALKVIVKKSLLKFRQEVGSLPHTILMFRDGVSEGYFDYIKTEEYKDMLDACFGIDQSYRPKITFVVVKKRHHTRMKPVKDADSVGKPRNVPPGTVVDDTIIHPMEEEFFLTSHVGIQGTARPTRYHVIHDDSNFSMQQLEQITYCLCYTFVRCTHPVSYPSPTYYAHLAAFRARALVEKFGETKLETLKKKFVIHETMKGTYPMFFI